MVTTHFHVGIWSHAGAPAQSDTQTHRFSPSTILILARFSLQFSIDESSELELEPKVEGGAVVVTGATGSDSQLAPASP